jgi:hypothetical protein
VLRINFENDRESRLTDWTAYHTRLIVLHLKGEAMEPGMAGLGRMGANITDAKLIASLRNEFAGHAVKKE